MIAYRYPNAAHARWHGPQGYEDYTSYKPWLRDEFAFECVYCLNREKWSPHGADGFGVDHVVAQATDPNLAVDYENLVYACARCNSYKQDNMVLNPCHVVLSNHVRINDDGTVEALTAEGDNYVRVLGLDDPVISDFRRRLLRVLVDLGVSDDLEARERLAEWLGFPLDLPNLSRLRPLRNTRPEGVERSYYAMRMRGELARRY